MTAGEERAWKFYNNGVFTWAFSNMDVLFFFPYEILFVASVQKTLTGLGGVRDSKRNMEIWISYVALADQAGNDGGGSRV